MIIVLSRLQEWFQNIKVRLASTNGCLLTFLCYKVRYEYFVPTQQTLKALLHSWIGSLEFNIDENFPMMNYAPLQLKEFYVCQLLKFEIWKTLLYWNKSCSLLQTRYFFKPQTMKASSCKDAEYLIQKLKWRSPN